MAAQRILVIEDEPGAREALESLLAEDGYVVCSAGTGRGGLDRLLDFRPDTVVCDFYLPDIDGREVLREVRTRSSDGVTFIMLTAGCGGEEAELLLRREVDYFFRKPVNLRSFRNVLQHSKNGASAAPPHLLLSQKDATHG